ncbi:hypothetical protein CsSME_00053402 [Camellia sinensis var. sinensis]
MAAILDIGENMDQSFLQFDPAPRQNSPTTFYNLQIIPLSSNSFVIVKTFSEEADLWLLVELKTKRNHWFYHFLFRAVLLLSVDFLGIPSGRFVIAFLLYCILNVNERAVASIFYILK